MCISRLELCGYNWYYEHVSNDVIKSKEVNPHKNKYMTQEGRGQAINTTPIMNILGSDGKGSKWELIFKSLSGKITNLQIFDGDYGKNLLVTLTYNGGEDTISFNTATPFGEDFMKKLPNFNLDEYVTITPYSFIDDNGKTRKGITVTQGDVKLQNYFYDAEKKKNLHKYPTPEGDTDKFDKDDWKIYFTHCRKFLVKNTEDVFLPAFAHLKQVVAVDYPTEEAKADQF